MPNWCSVELYAVAEVNDPGLDEIADLFSNPLPFSKIRPIPNEVDWYSWNTTTWGTKWDINSPEGYSQARVERDEVGGALTVFMETAWSPPEGILKELRSKYPNLHFTMFYREDNTQMAGYL